MDGAKRHAKIHGSGDHDTTVETTGHHAKHQSGGADEINVGSLVGVLANDQPVQTHGASKHDATTLDTVSKLAAALFCRVKTGTYTGDGNATQAVTGVGFQPKILMILRRADDAEKLFGVKTDQETAQTFLLNLSAPYWNYTTDMIISLNADGFTVGDGTGLTNVFNLSGQGYTFIAWG